MILENVKKMKEYEKKIREEANERLFDVMESKEIVNEMDLDKSVVVHYFYDDNAELCLTAIKNNGNYNIFLEEKRGNCFTKNEEMVLLIYNEIISFNKKVAITGVSSIAARLIFNFLSYAFESSREQK